MYKLGIYNHNGQIGKPAVQRIIPHLGKKMSLVVFHRPGSDTTWLPKEVELREMDLEKEGVEEIAGKVSDIEVFVCLLTTFAVGLQKNLVPALAKSKKLITFFPSDFGMPWTEEQLSHNPTMRGKEDILEQARNAGLPLTQFKNGLVIPMFFDFGFVPLDGKDNTLWLYKEALDKEVHFTSGAHIGRSLADVLINRSPAEFANKEFYVVQYHPTGKELIEVLEKVNGKKPDVEYYTDEHFFHDLKHGKPFPDGIKASLRNVWKEGFPFPGEKLNPDDGEPNLEECMKQYKASKAHQ